ncbi:hypothetical protein ACTMNS_13020, partial [Staphylococcus haemolyticus]
CILGWVVERVFNPKPNNLDRRFRIYRETLSRFSCAASGLKQNKLIHLYLCFRQKVISNKNHMAQY